MKSTPSRWSISCWMTRASSPVASMRIGSPLASWAPFAAGVVAALAVFGLAYLEPADS